MFFRGQKGSPVKFEFDIFVEDIKPWTSAHAQTNGPPIPLLLAWRRGRSRSGSTKSVMPSVGGAGGGRVVFNESFLLPATLFERKSGEFQKKSLSFALLEDESAKVVKISRQLAVGELDLSQFGNANEPQSISIPLAIGLAGTHAEGDPTLSLRVNSSGRLPSSSSIFSRGSLSSGGRSSVTGSAQPTSYFLPESDDSDDEHESIDSFTDDDDSSRSSDDEPKSTGTKRSADRQKLLSSVATPPPPDTSKLMFPNPVIARSRPASPASRSSYGQSSGSSSGAKATGETTKSKEMLRLSEEEMREKLLGLPEPPRKAAAVAAKALEVAAASAKKSMEEARILAEKSVEAARKTAAGRDLEATAASAAKSVEAAKNSSTGKRLEAVVTLVGAKTADVAAVAAKSVEIAAASLAKSVISGTTKVSSELGVSPAVAAAAAYSAKKASQSKDDRPAESRVSEFPQKRISSPPDTGIKLDLSGPRQADSAAAVSVPPPPPQAAAVARGEKAESEKRGPDADDQNDGNRSVLGDARAKLAMVEKRAIEELRAKVAAAEDKAVANQEKGKEIANRLKEKMRKREDELRDTAAIEVALYSVTAEHTSSSHKVHTPARRLARLYVHAFKNWSAERRASSARNSIQGLVVAVRACGNDVPRLTYWWSNIVVLRESIMQACNVEPAPDSEGATTSGSDNSFAERAKRSQELRKRTSRQGSTSEILGFKGFNNDWQDCNTYVVALLKVEAWIHGRILECVWWQAMAPPMQVGGGDTTARLESGALGATFINVRDELNRFALKVKGGLGELNKFAGDVKEFFTKERQDGNLSQLGDARQGSISIEIWKNAFTDALKRLCPLQGHEAECGCLPVLSRQVIAECVERLDVAMFNGIMRNPEEDSPTDPLADPVTDLSVLPIPAGALSFGAGSQLKNAVVTWSTWLATLLSVKDPESSNKDASVEQSELAPEEIQRQKKFNLLKATSELLLLPKDMIDMAMRRDAARKEAEKASPYFVLLRAAGDILMLPKDMLMDKSVRKEICPQLKLPLIRRILCNFVPDEFAPDPISPSLVAAINTEVSLERQMLGGEGDIEDMSVAPVPVCIYIPPSSAFVRLWIGEPAGVEEWGNTPSSLLRKGYGSDDELNNFQTPLAWLKESPNTRNSTFPDAMDIAEMQSAADDSRVYTGRYQLLKEVWGPPS